MKTKILAVLLCLFMISISGCATVEPIKDAVYTRNTINASKDQTWEALLEFITNKGFNIQNIDKSSGVLTVAKSLSEEEFKKLTNERVEEAPWPFGMMGAHYGSGVITMTILVKEIAVNETDLNISTKMTGERQDIFGSRNRLDEKPLRNVDSNKAIEQEIINSVRAKVGNI